MGMMLRRRNADENGNITTSKILHVENDTDKKAESEKDEPKTVKRGRKPNDSQERLSWQM